ncbi:hypothetical protein [Chondrinema litorale]|uniref:hypothetical protein n=1 Tax=Chondrinema litorale TaxID=2994555 RepID=UPI002543E53B|nr:hypothetical protein [Chondrinema litorale]UZR94565.1 hypothetical protein OQ292_01870 [Chondrinema litorale]
MKSITLLLFFFTFSFTTFSQIKNNKLGAKGGIVDVDMIGDRGINFELFYERSLKYNFTLGFDLGVANQSNFPEIFQATSLVAVNGLPVAVDEEIMALDGREGFLYGYRKYNVQYAQAYIKYTIPIKIFGNQISALTGLMMQHSEGTQFSLRQFKYRTTDYTMISYTPRYDISSYTRSGWLLGASLDREMQKSFVFSVDAKYNLVWDSKKLLSHFSVLRVGIAKRF